MLSVFICDDNMEHLQHITKCVKNFIMIENLLMQVEIATETPGHILAYIAENKIAGLYFLDVDLNCEMDGIKLAEAIREHDPRGFIVFITADAESLSLTFKYKVEAMDYIVKGAINLDSRIGECVANAYAKYTAKSSVLQKNFVFNESKDSTISVGMSEILYFEVTPMTPHRVYLYTNNSRYDFRGKLSNVQKSLDSSFFRVHRGCIVNLSKIAKIDSEQQKLLLINGDECDIAAKYISKVKKLLVATM